MSGLTIETLDAEGLEREVERLAEILRACVAAGASVNFVEPFTQADAVRFWREKTAPAVRDGGRVLLVARDGEDLLGTVQLDLDTPPNQAHRGEVGKLLVHPEARRRGVARALMAALEHEAKARGRTLLTLDTITDSPARPLYRSLGFRTAGVLPGFSRHPQEDRLEDTEYMFKVI